MPVPTKDDMKDFVAIDGWEEIRRTDHHRYVKKLVDGKILRTRVSFGRGPAFDDPGLWRRVWSRQLDLRSEDAFWEALRKREPVDRGLPAAVEPPPHATKPAWLFHYLVDVAGLDAGAVLAMTEEEAMAHYLEHVGFPRQAGSGTGELS